MKKILLFIICISFSIPSFAATVYVKETGGAIYYESGAASCDEVTDADTSGDLEAAADAAGASGSLYICAGTYSNTEIDSDGSLDVGVNNLTVTVSETAAIDTCTTACIDIDSGITQFTLDGGDNLTVTAPASVRGFSAYANAWSMTSLTIKDSTWDGSSDTSSELIYIGASQGYTVSGVEISGNTIQDAGAEGTKFYWQNTSYMYDVSVLNNTYSSVADNGIQVKPLESGASAATVYGYGFIIQGNTVSGNRDGIEVQLITSTGGTSIINRNTLTNIGDGVETNVNGIRCGACNDVVIENNTVTTVTSASGDGNGIIIDQGTVNSVNTASDGVIARYNKITGCTTINGAGISNFKSINSQIYQNESYKNEVGIAYGEDSGTPQSTGGTIYNNSISLNTLGNDPAGIRVRAGAGSVTIRNNALYGNGGYDLEDDTDNSLTDTDYNYADFTGNVTDWPTETNKVDSSSDPFVDSANNDLKLAPASTCIGAGTDVGYGDDIGRWPYTTVMLPSGIFTHGQ